MGILTENGHSHINGNNFPEKTCCKHTVGTQFPSTDVLDKPSGKEKDTDDLIDKTTDLENENLRYGWGKWKPECLQAFNSIRWFVFFTCVFSFFQGYIVNGVINAILSTLENRFELPSSKSGLIVSSNDFFALFLVLIISYYGGQRNKPKLITIGVVTLGIGSFVFSLPHFLTGVYQVSSDTSVFENVCRDENVTDESHCLVDKADDYSSVSNLPNFLYVFMLGNALHGAGSTPMFVLGTTYIDDNSKAKMTPLYLGLVYASASLGVAAGYMLGSQTLNIFTDFNTVDKIGITPFDPRWVGAWWISFFISGCIMLIVAIPISGFPKQLPGTAKLRLEKESEAYKSNEGKTDDPSSESWKEFPKMLWALVRNPTFMFLSLATCTEGVIVSGIAAFGAKFMQEKFNLPAAFAGFLMGIITLPGAGGGVLFGGYVAKKLKLKCRGIIRMNVIVAIVALICGGLFLIHCPTQKIAGVTTTYGTQKEWKTVSNLTSVCNANCDCSAKSYEPVCGMDGLIYFTPCHAGCSSEYEWMEGSVGPFKMYKDCACVTYSMSLMYQAADNRTNLTGTESSFLTTPPGVSLSTDSINETFTNISSGIFPPPGAHQGACLSDCKLVWVIVPFLFLGMFLTFTIVSPAQTATMRCVSEKQKSLAIGFQWLFLRLLGTTPGPLILGSIIDSACKVWQDLCGETGSCWIYEKADMGIRIFVWWCLVKGLCIISFFCAQHFHVVEKTPKHNETNGKGDAHPVELLDARESNI